MGQNDFLLRGNLRFDIRILIALQPRQERIYKEPKMKECYVDETYGAEKLNEREYRYDKPEVAREMVGTEKVTITRTYEGGQLEKMERQKYPSDREVGRILIDETVEDTPKDIRGKITDSSQKKETTATCKDETGIHRTDVKDFERTHIREEQREHFRRRRPEEQFLPEADRLDSERKVSLKQP